MIMSQASLNEFPDVAAPGKITVAEYGAKLMSLPSHSDNPVDGREFSDKLLNYHQIDGTSLKPIVPYKIPSIKTTKYPEALIISRDEGLIKGVWDAFMDEGLRGVDQYLKRVGLGQSPAIGAAYRILSAFCSVTDRLYRLKNEVAMAFFPHLKLKPQEIVQECSQVRNWKKSWTRAVEWHPHFSKLALALTDDTIRIFTVGEEVIPLLRSPDQRIVSCMTWRPYTEVELAVGVENGILIWNMESPHSIKPGGCQTQLLKAKNHAPVTSVEYSFSGLLLLSSSTADTAVYIWDVSTWKSTPLRRLGGGGVPLASWSPHEDRILTTSPTSVFRVWERKNYWKPRRWTTPEFPIEAACWSPDGSTLAFASGGTIYAIHFSLTEIDKFINENDCIATPIFDVSDTTARSEDGKLEYKVGGRVRKMEWDQTGNRLALFFDDSELVVVFRVQNKSTYYLAPCGYIRGFPDEYPITIAFQKDFQDGALLTVAWNSGRLQYVPFLFAVPDGTKNLLHEDHYKIPVIVQQQSKNRKSNENSSNVFSPLNSTSNFRTTTFSVLPESEDSEYVSGIREAAEPARLFSIGGRSPDF